MAEAASTHEQGQAVLEFALVIPILLLFLCGMITVGLWMYGQLVVLHAAEEAVRELSLTNSNESALAAGQKVMRVLQKGDTAHFIFSPRFAGDPGRKVGSYVTVKVSYNSPFVLFPFASDGGLGGLFSVITTEATARMECDPDHILFSSGSTCPALR